jgi:hypothetical protein
VTWVRLDDGFPTHPKVIGLTDGAFRAHVSGLCYAGQHLTDGFVPGGYVKDKAALELVERRLWSIDDQRLGYIIHDFLDWNPSRDKVTTERRKAVERRAKGGQRSGDVRANATNPDPTRPDPTPNPKAELRSVPGNPHQPTHDQLYLASRMSESVTPAVIVTWNKAYGVSEVTDVMRSLHQFATDVDDWVAYVRGTLNARAEAM